MKHILRLAAVGAFATMFVAAPVTIETDGSWVTSKVYADGSPSTGPTDTGPSTGPNSDTGTPNTGPTADTGVPNTGPGADGGTGSPSSPTITVLKLLQAWMASN
jgi:hypothetical protein